MYQNEPERGPLFDFERLIVYQKAMQLRCLKRWGRKVGGFSSKS
ncbi:MAG: hypothetical protein ACYS47_14880 [Planctomycetota bacterium]|jgi:hypothetical protein